MQLSISLFVCQVLSPRHVLTQACAQKNGQWITGADDYCYPDEATNANNNQCKPFDPDAPIYYNIAFCGHYMKLVWRIWYGQKGCDPFGVDNGHGDDCEHITINFARKSPDDDWVQDSMTWFQHSGW